MTESAPVSRRALHVMIGGFLGAGKSTAVGRLARRLTDEGLRVGLITNDQADALVDTASLRAQGFAVAEIAGGCFCCRFDSLKTAADELSGDAAGRPDVFIAEPVGSCTDLVSTVSYPLRRLYGDAYRIAPLSVLVDPVRAQRVLGLADGKRFSPKVTYVYRKQLEEARFIVVNKRDLLSDDEAHALRTKLALEFPRAEIFEVSALGGTGLDAWFDAVLGAELGGDPTLDIDYDTYAEGEALLGWLNATVTLDAASEIDGNELLVELAGRAQRELAGHGIEIAHFKMTLSPIGSAESRAAGEESTAAALGEIASVHAVRSDAPAEPGHRLTEPLRRGEIIVNLRAEGDPGLLRAVLESSIGESRALRLTHAEAFRPGRPTPTHRMTADEARG